MERLIFHGSSSIIDRPVFGAGNPHNDYGQAFYCTEHRDMASEWAVGNGTDGYVNSYRLEMSGLRVMDLNGKGLTALHWLTTLLQNRHFDVRAPLASQARAFLLENFSVDLSDYDVVEGYRADDSYFAFAQDFLSGVISYQQLQRAMKLGDLGRQIAIKSEKAFSHLCFDKADPVPKQIWLPRRDRRDQTARKTYFNVERNLHVTDGLFIVQILKEEIGPNDARLQ